VTLPPGLLEAAKELSRRSGVTPFMTLLAAFKAFLFCLTGREDLCVGSPVASRPLPETKGLIGFFANTVVLRTRVSAGSSYREVMGRVREATLGAIANQALPFDKLVEALRPPRDLGRMPLFQVNFRVLKAPPVPLRLAGLDVSPPEFVDSGTSKFDLALELVAAPGASGYGSSGFWEYCSDLFEESTIATMADEFEQLLAALLAEPDRPLDRIRAVGEIRERWRGRPLG
jgi:non-ribosomal peptide synthetase component F